MSHLFLISVTADDDEKLREKTLLLSADDAAEEANAKDKREEVRV